MEDNSNVWTGKHIGGCLLLFFGGIFIIYAISILVSLLFKSNLEEYFSMGEGGTNLRVLKLSFWLSIVGLIIFHLYKGKFKNLRVTSNFPYEEDEEEKKQRERKKKES